MIAAAVFWFLIGREESKRYLYAAREFEQGKFVQAIQRYEDFLERFPGDQEAETARQELSRLARVRKEIDSSPPDWAVGLEELKALIERHRDDVGFPGLEGDIVIYAQQIAEGASLTAERQHDPKFFPYSEEATKIVERYLDDSERLKTALNEILAAPARRKRRSSNTPRSSKGSPGSNSN